MYTGEHLQPGHGEVQAQTACAAVEKDAKDLKAPEPKVEPSKE